MFKKTKERIMVSSNLGDTGNFRGYKNQLFDDMDRAIHEGLWLVQSFAERYNEKNGVQWEIGVDSTTRYESTRVKTRYILRPVTPGIEFDEPREVIIREVLEGSQGVYVRIHHWDEYYYYPRKALFAELEKTWVLTDEAKKAVDAHDNFGKMVDVFEYAKVVHQHANMNIVESVTSSYQVFKDEISDGGRLFYVWANPSHVNVSRVSTDAYAHVFNVGSSEKGGLLDVGIFANNEEEAVSIAKDTHGLIQGEVLMKWNWPKEKCTEVT